MQPLVKIFEAVGALFLYTLTTLKFIGAFLLVIGVALLIPFFLIEHSLGYDLLGMVGLAGKLIEWGYTAVLVGVSILVLPLYWIIHDLRQDPVIVGLLLLVGCAWLGVKALKAYSKHLIK